MHRSVIHHMNSFFVQGVEYNTQVLNMSGNVIPLLMSQQFSALGLLNLQRISMSRCGLVQIDGHAFGGLTNLVELDLSQNLLKEVKKKIPSIVFNPSLFWRMVLHQNEIKGCFAVVVFVAVVEMNERIFWSSLKKAQFKKHSVLLLKSRELGTV